MASCAVQATRLRKGHAHQGRERPVPHPRAPPPDAGQQARAHPVPDAQHPHAGARRPEVPRGRRRRARRARRARDAVSLQRRRQLLLHGHRRPTSRSRSQREALGDSKDYLDRRDRSSSVEFYDDEPVGIELPPTVDLLVKETVPGIKGATASTQVKPATLETGLVVQVPPFVNEGDKIRVNTETGEYQSRA